MNYDGMTAFIDKYSAIPAASAGATVSRTTQGDASHSFEFLQPHLSQRVTPLSPTDSPLAAWREYVALGVFFFIAGFGVVGGFQ